MCNLVRFLVCVCVIFQTCFFFLMKTRLSQSCTSWWQRVTSRSHLHGAVLVVFLIFRGAETNISAMEKVSWHPGVDVEWQKCAWADSSFCTGWGSSSYRKGVCRSGVGVPEEQSSLFADTLYGQTTDEFKRVSMQKSNTLLSYGFCLPGARTRSSL